MSKRALVIGINDYAKIKPLRGCVNDARNIESLISKNADNSRNFDTKMMTSENGNQVTKKDIKAAVTTLLTKPADMAFLYFSGHGTATNLGGYLCAYDTEAYDEGFSMQELLALINQAPIKEIVVILDCCQSGALGEVPSLGQTGISFIKEGTSILTASRSDESAMEVNGAGIFTSLICDALSGSAADLLGVVTPAGVYSHVEQSFSAWDQRPLFKSYVSRSTCLRMATPKVDLQLLRDIPTLFADADRNHNMDPSYEHSHRAARTENVEKFKGLKKLQTAGLIHVNRKGDPDLYYAALENASCKLSPLGRFYWHLATAGKL